jgi:hypothetical protein
MNIGFAEALKDRDDWQCFKFHGISLSNYIPLDNNNTVKSV